MGVITHGQSGTMRSPTYRTWSSMKMRCLNPKAIDYLRYGGRGISICDRWLHSFENFLADMGERPQGMQLDRINNDGDYEPTNCRWISKRQNACNRKSSVFIVIDGKKLTATEWADITGISASTILGRIKKGWNPVRAATQPVDFRYSKTKRSRVA